MTAAPRLDSAFRSHWSAPFAGSLSEWARSLALPQSTRADRFEPEEAPWLSAPADALVDPEVRQVTFIGPAGCAKSLLGEIYMGYVVKNDSGLIYYVCQDDDAAKDVMEDRMFPMFLANHVLASVMPLDRSKKRIAKVQFSRATLYALGANKNNARSKRVKHLIREETHLWEPGMMTAFKKRVNAVSGYKILDLTTGTLAGDETSEEWEASTRHEWHVCCPECKQAQIMENRRLGFERSDRTIDPDGGFRMNAIRESVRYPCAHCDAKWQDTPETRTWLRDSGHYLQTNTNASASHHGYHINALAIHWISWGDLIQEWLTANRAAKGGAMDPLKNYIMERLAEAWDESPREENPDAVSKRAGDYQFQIRPGEWIRKPGEWEDAWPELTRFLTVDVQDGYFWAGCRAWAADGSSRQVGCWGGREGQHKLTTFESVEDLREALGVEPARTWLDCAHWTKQVQMRCAQYGWQAMWGDDSKSWAHDIDSPDHPRNIAYHCGAPFRQVPEKSVRLPFSPPLTGHASQGRAGPLQTCTYRYWSNPAIKDFWHFLWAGGGTPYTHAKDAPAWYRAQTNVEFKRKRYSKATGREEWAWVHGQKDNHMTDCYDAETEVLCENGWRKFSEWNGQRVATVALDGMRLEYQEPSAFIAKPHSGPMVSLKSNAFDFLVTPGHRMIVWEKKFIGRKSVKKLAVKPASSLSIWDTIPCRVDWVGKEDDLTLPALPRFPERKISRLAAARLAGWFATEGHLTSGTWAYSIGLSQNPGAKQEIMRADIAALGINFCLKGGRQFVISNPQIRALLKDCGRGSAGKKLPRWLLDSSPRILSEFLDVAITGDGWRRPHQTVICTISKQLADDYSEVILKAGGRPSINIRKALPYCIAGRSGTNTRDQYHVTLKKSDRLHLRDGNNRSAISTQHYEGNVYCLTVPNGTLIVRRSGQVMVCGNCEQMGLVAAMMDYRINLAPVGLPAEHAEMHEN